MSQTPAATPALPAERAEALRLLRALTQAHGAPGHEDAVRQRFASELGAPLSSDRTGSVLHEVPNGQAAPKIMLTAHMDEVGFAIQHITREGYLKLVPLGGWWSHTLLSQRVRVLTRSGREILGVFACKPPHLQSAGESDKVLKLDDLFVDVGASSAAQAREEFGLALGDPVVPASEFTPLANPDLLLAKAFDNRVGMALMLHAGRLLRQRPHPNALYCVATAQEEVGCRGAITASALCQPDLALVLEGPPADDLPGSPSDERQGALHGGPQIRLLDPQAINNPALTQWVQSVAKELGLPHQVAVRKSGATDAKSIHLSGTGVPTVVIGVPARYIHSHNSIITVPDYLNTLALVLALAERLDRATVASFTRFV